MSWSVKKNFFLKILWKRKQASREVERLAQSGAPVEVGSGPGSMPLTLGFFPGSLSWPGLCLH